MVDDTQALQNLDSKTLSPPKPSRIGSAMAIRARIQEMTVNDEIRANNRRKIRKLIDGERPFDQAKLAELGQGDRTNFNPREAEGMADSAKTPFYTAIMRNARFATIQCDYGEQMQQRAQWSESLSEAFHQMLDEWPEHDYNIQLYQRDMCVFGVGITMWPDDKDWRWNTYPMSDCRVPDRTPSNIKKFTEFSLRRTINPVDLWSMACKDREKAKKMGWFPDRVEKALVKAAPVDLRQQNQFGDRWGEEYQNSLRRGDIQWNGSTSEILLADYLGREFDGTVTHCIVTSDAGQDTENPMEDEGLLFKKVGRYKEFSEVLCPFFFDVGTGDYHSVKGLGPKIFDFCMASARMLCTMIDGGIRSSALLLEATDANAMEQTQLITLNGATVVQPGFKVVQQRLGDNMEGILSVKREVASVLQNNTGQYTERVPAENQEPTLGQAQLNYRNRESLSESTMDRFCKTLDRQYTEVLRRAIAMGKPIYEKRHPKSNTMMPDEKPKNLDEDKELAYWFVRRCVEDGVPLEAIDMDWICSVKAARAVGSGSPAAQDMATAGLMQLYPILDEAGKNAALRDRVAFFVGQGNVDRYVRPFGEMQVPGKDEQQATDENNALRMPGGKVLPTYQDNHAIHFAIHMNDAGQHIQELQGGQADPQAVLGHLHNAGAHMKAHLDGMAGDPTRKDQLMQMNKQWLMMSKLTDQLQQHVDEAAQAQAAAQPPPQPQVDPALITGLVKTKGELALKAQKDQGDLQLKAVKQTQANRLKDINQAHNMRLKTLQAQHDQNLKALQTATAA